MHTLFARWESSGEYERKRAGEGLNANANGSSACSRIRVSYRFLRSSPEWPGDYNCQCRTAERPRWRQSAAPKCFSRQKCPVPRVPRRHLRKTYFQLAFRKKTQISRFQDIFWVIIQCFFFRGRFDWKFEHWRTGVFGGRDKLNHRTDRISGIDCTKSITTKNTKSSSEGSSSVKRLGREVGIVAPIESLTAVSFRNYMIFLERLLIYNIIYFIIL